MTQIKNGMQCLVENNLSHRDLKLANVFMAKNSKGELVCKIGDFGLAKVWKQDEVLTATASGTPATMAPEVMLKNYYDHKTSHRRLQWVHGLGGATVTAMYGKKKYDLMVSWRAHACTAGSPDVIACDS